MFGVPAKCSERPKCSQPPGVLGDGEHTHPPTTTPQLEQQCLLFDAPPAPPTSLYDVHRRLLLMPRIALDEALQHAGRSQTGAR